MSATIAQIRTWREDKEKQIRGRSVDAEVKEQRDFRNKILADEEERKARADKNRGRIAAGKAELDSLKDDLDRLDGNMAEARYLKDADRMKEIQDEIDKARKRRDEVNRELYSLTE